MAFLIPTLHTRMGLDLAKAGLVSAMPSFGMVLTLIAWGYLVDRVGERLVLTLGSALTTAAAPGRGGIAVAGGDERLPAARRDGGGKQQLGERAVGGRLVPTGAARAGDGHPADRSAARSRARRAGDSPAGAEPRVGFALLFPAAVCGVAALVCAVGVLDPPRPPRAEAPADDLANPYRGSGVLWRIHAVSVLLVVPQCVVWTFTLVWLITDRGWSAASAGGLVTVAQVLGALGRVAAGRWSDWMGSRLRPIRIIAVGAAASMLALAVADWSDSALSIPVMIAASVITVSDNGLAFTAIAEIAGPFWSGRALGAQNTSQLLTAGLTPPLFGALIGGLGFPVAFAVCALFPAAALPLVPPDPPDRPG